jgi:hypothetical protein
LNFYAFIGANTSTGGNKVVISKESTLLNAYLSQGKKMSGTVARVPLYLLDDDDAGLKVYTHDY